MLQLGATGTSASQGPGLASSWKLNRYSIFFFSRWSPIAFCITPRSRSFQSRHTSDCTYPPICCIALVLGEVERRSHSSPSRGWNFFVKHCINRQFVNPGSPSLRVCRIRPFVGGRPDLVVPKVGSADSWSGQAAVRHDSLEPEASGAARRCRCCRGHCHPGQQ